MKRTLSNLLWWHAVRRRAATAVVAIASAVAPLGNAGAAGQVAEYGRSQTYGDFDGDGALDRAFGYPRANDDRGTVVVVYGDGEVAEFNRGTPYIFDTAEVDDYFGDSLSAGDIDNDGYDDLVVGVPGDDVWYGAARVDAGSIHVIYGSSTGLTGVGDQVIDRDSSGIDGSPVANDRFGEAVAVADFNCDGREDVAVGVPWDDAQSGRTNDGSINVIYGTSSGLSSVQDFYHQGSPSVSGSPETNDEFGSSLAVGNFNGTTCDDLAVGVVGENTDGGYVVFFYGAIHWATNFSFANQTGLSQNTMYAEDGLESHDAFGAQMWAFDDNGDAYDDLMVAVPGETCTNGRDGGYHLFRGDSAGFVTGGDLNGYDYLVCMDWDDIVIQDIMDEYRRCVDFAEPGCGEALTADFQSLSRGTDAEYTAACEVGFELALDACEHWVTDPVNCDVDLCIASALELSAISHGCQREGDVLTHAYP